MVNRSPIAVIGAALILAAPLLFGCLPPWASGFLLAGVCVLGAAQVIANTFQDKDRLPIPFELQMTLGLLLAWLMATILYDVAMGTEHNRIPALSLSKLGYLGAFAAALYLGATYAQSLRRLKQILFGMACLGLALSGFALAHYYGWDVKTLFDWPVNQKRICGLYTNFNRFATLLAVCWICACGLLLGCIDQYRQSLPVLKPKTIVLFAAVLLMAVCIGLTRSRLTMLSMVVSLGIAALGWWSLRALVLQRLMPDSAIGKALKIAPFLALAVWGTWGFLFDIDNSQISLTTSLSREVWSSAMRYTAFCAAWSMLLQNPLGYGLGAFETFFTQVRPSNLPDSWRELHCDWMQWTLEAGVPALLLGLAALALWCRACWMTIRQCYPNDRQVLYLRLLPCVGLLVPLWCSMVDFPLREPASAVLFCFLAGVLCGTARQTIVVDGETERHGDGETERQGDGETERRGDGGKQLLLKRDAKILTVSSLALVPIFLCGAWIAARNSVAYAYSPWMGRIACPQPRSEDLSAWQAALQIDSSDPELFFRAGITAAAAANDGENLSLASEYLRQALTLQPFDYRFFLTAGIMAERAGQMDEAFRLRAQAAALAPGNLSLREENARLYLRKRESLPLDDELNRVESTDADTVRWQHAIRGAMSLKRNHINEGLAELQQVVTADASDSKEIISWLSEQVSTLSPDICKALVVVLLDRLPAYPQFALVLARKLMDGQHWSLAHQLLEKTASKSTDLGALWAELSLRLGDFPAATQRADVVLQRSGGAPNWVRWYDNFRIRLKQREEQSKK
ncbi:MAG: O-antigen ligase family protein [Planctomycetota bacterium]